MAWLVSSSSRPLRRRFLSSRLSPRLLSSWGLRGRFELSSSGDKGANVGGLFTAEDGGADLGVLFLGQAVALVLSEGGCCFVGADLGDVGCLGAT